MIFSLSSVFCILVAALYISTISDLPLWDKSASVLIVALAIFTTFLKAWFPDKLITNMHCSCGFESESAVRFKRHMKTFHNMTDIDFTLYMVDNNATNKDKQSA